MAPAHRRIALLFAALSLCAVPLVQSAPRAEAAGSPHCAPGTLPVRPGSPNGTAQGQLVALRPDTGPRAGGTQVTLAGAGLTPYTRVLFGTVTPDGCFTGREATDVVALGDTALIAVAPEWPAAATVSVYAATPCGRLTNALPFTYVD
ncbi:IPT/TIG domain-containing protein [Streptomyces sp. NPDC059382]|uniref:IPT/TIG domain-containing protein n=1 Tax=Streptomyces sp. NPDC059382 TaxID=3346816 RepID=UPI0036AA4987